MDDASARNTLQHYTSTVRTQDIMARLNYYCDTVISRGTWARSAAEDASPDYNSNAEGDRFSWWAYPGSLAVTKGILAQLAFKDSMVHGILQFTPSIAFRYVLHRCKSLDIRCRESFYIMCQNTTRTKTVSGAMQCGGERTSSSASEPKVSRGVEHLKPTICVQTYSRVGLHAADRPRRRNPNTSPDHSIGQERIAGRRDEPTGAHQRRTDRPNPRSNYELFNCNNLNIRYWSWNYRGCWHQTCPPMDPR
ncbi:hypothetical protein RYX36_009737 [Vicia faba]